MWNAFETLAKANVDHHDNHPSAHAAITAVLAVGGLVVFSKIHKRLTKNDPTTRSGQYAK